MTTVTIAIPTKYATTEVIKSLDALKNQSRLPDQVLIGEESSRETSVIRGLVNKRYYPFTVTVLHAPGGVGAAREYLRNQVDDGYLFCLDTEVNLPKHWIQNHLKLHDEYDGHTVVSGPWHYTTEYTKICTNPYAGEYFIEATCSMHTETARLVGGWDSRFARGCDWDFRIRMHKHPHVRSVVSTSVSCTPKQSNSSPVLHLKKQLRRPTSIPYLSKYGPWYARFSPMHVLGDITGVVLTVLLPVVLLHADTVSVALYTAAAGLLVFAYAVVNQDPNESLVGDLIRGIGIYSIGVSVLLYPARRIMDG